MRNLLTALAILASSTASATPGPQINGNQINPQTAIAIASMSVTGTGGLTVTATGTISGNAFSVGASTFVVKAGNVGIGRTSPTDTNSLGGNILDINGPVYTRQNGSPTHYGLFGASSSHQYLEASDDIYVYTGANGNPSMYFSSTNNNVAIGGYSSVGPYNVDVASGIEVQRSGILDGTGNFVNGLTMGGYDALGYDAAGQYVVLGGYHSSQFLGTKFYGNGSLRMTVLSGGNVGVGTAAPSQLLSVNGTVSLNTNAGTQLYYCSGGTDSGVIVRGNSGGFATVCTTAGGSMVALGIYVP